ncbi:hypothetical protein AAEP93_011380 [Penicillium crustosum]
MATATKIELSFMADTGVYSSGLREDTARATSDALQEDMELHHIFFNDEKFHNHTVHHLLSLYALGAGPEDINAAYKRNSTYQRPVYPTNMGVVHAMYEEARFTECLGKEVNYPNYLAFFQREIDAYGVGAVLNQYVFSGDDRAESMLSRLFGGVLHPIIHLGYGLEFNQPAIVAQALSLAAVHGDWMGRNFLLPAERMANGIKSPEQASLFQLVNEIREDNTLKQSVRWTDTVKIRDGVLNRAPQQMLSYAARYTVSENQVTDRLTDMISTVAYYISTAQRPNKEVKFDFFLIHSANLSIFFPKLMALPLLNQQAKLRMLEWKGRMDLLMYVSSNSPDLLINEVIHYPVNNDWLTIFARCAAHPIDDGHLIKFVRALAYGERVCQESGGQSLPISGDMWLRIGNMVMDSTVEGSEQEMWSRYTGFDEAWENLSERATI